MRVLAQGQVLPNLALSPPALCFFNVCRFCMFILLDLSLFLSAGRSGAGMVQGSLEPTLASILRRTPRRPRPSRGTSEREIAVAKASAQVGALRHQKEVLQELERPAPQPALQLIHMLALPCAACAQPCGAPYIIGACLQGCMQARRQQQLPAHSHNNVIAVKGGGTWSHWPTL